MDRFGWWPVPLPAGWETTVVVIVFQSLVELFGMVFYLWQLPRLFAEIPSNPHKRS